MGTVGAQGMGCYKCCGQGNSQNPIIGHRSCSGLGSAACHVIICPEHFDCNGQCDDEYSDDDTYNDLCAYSEYEWECESIVFHFCHDE
jgi:hypothetical protein